MTEFRWIFVCGILFIAAPNVAIPEVDSSNNGIKFDLEAAVNDTDTDNENIQFLDKVQKVIGKMKTILETRSGKRRSNDIKFETFSDFIKDLLITLDKYNDNNLETFLRIFVNEMQKYNYQGCEFYEIAENPAFNRFLTNLLHQIETQPLDIIRNVLQIVADKIERKQYDNNEGELVEVINSMYRQDSLEKMHTFLFKIDAYKQGSRNTPDLVKIVKDGLRSSVFDHYTTLNHNARKALESQFNVYWESLSPDLPLKSINSKKFKAQKSMDTTVNLIKVRTNTNEEFGFLGNIKKYKDRSLYVQSSTTRPRPYRKENLKFKDNKQIIKRTDSIMEETNNKRVNRKSLQSKTMRPIKTTQLSKDNLRYETDAYEYLIAEPKKSRLTVKTSNPELVHKWTKAQPVRARKQFSSDNKQYSWEEDNINSWMQNPRRLNGIRLIKELDATVNVALRSAPPRRRNQKFDKSKRQGSIKNIEDPEAKSNRRRIFEELSSERLTPMEIESQTCKRTGMSSKPRNQRTYPAKSIISSQNLQLNFKGNKRIRPYRRNEVSRNEKSNSSLPVSNKSNLDLLSATGKLKTNYTIVKGSRESHSEKNRLIDLIPDNNKNRFDEVSGNLDFENHKNHLDNVEVPKLENQAKEDIKYLNNAKKNNPTKLYKDTVNVTNGMVNENLSENTHLYIQNHNDLKSSIYINEKFKIDAINNEGFQSEYIKTFSNKSEIKSDNIDYTDTNKQKGKTSNPIGGNLKTTSINDTPEAGFNIDKQVKNNNSFMKKDLRKSNDNFIQGIADSYNKFEAPKYIHQYKNIAADPKNTGANKATDNIKTEANIISTTGNFNDINGIVYADLGFKDSYTITTIPTVTRQSLLLAQQMMKNLTVEDSAENLRNEVTNSGDINIGADGHTGNSKENEEDDMTGDMFPDVQSILGRIAPRTLQVRIKKFQNPVAKLNRYLIYEVSSSETESLTYIADNQDLKRSNPKKYAFRYYTPKVRFKYDEQLQNYDEIYEENDYRRSNDQFTEKVQFDKYNNNDEHNIESNIDGPNMIEETAISTDNIVENDNRAVSLSTTTLSSSPQADIGSVITTKPKLGTPIRFSQLLSKQMVRAIELANLQNTFIEDIQFSTNTEGTDINTDTLQKVVPIKKFPDTITELDRQSISEALTNETESKIYRANQKVTSNLKNYTSILLIFDKTTTDTDLKRSTNQYPENTKFNKYKDHDEHKIERRINVPNIIEETAKTTAKPIKVTPVLHSQWLSKQMVKAIELANMQNTNIEDIRVSSNTEESGINTDNIFEEETSALEHA